MFVKAGSRTTPEYLLSEALELAWDQLVTAKQVDQANLRPEIAQSWARCLARELDPDDCGQITRINDLAEKLEDNRRLMKAALRHLGRLHEILPDSGFMVLLAGADGTVLSLTGPKKMRALAELSNLRPGAGIEEGTIGTTALGLSLAGHRPARVRLNEHYCRIFHAWCCSSAPILDQAGRLLGVLNAANQSLVRHPPQVLVMVKMAAEAIEYEISYRRLHEEQRKTSVYFSAALEASPEALIIFDNEDNPAYLNQRAQHLLGLTAPDQAGAVVRDFEGARRQLSQGRDWIDLEFSGPGGTVALEARLKPMRDEEAVSHGLIGALRRRTGGEDESELRYDFRDFVHDSEVMKQLFRQARKVASTDHTLLIEGESGTGKEILAQSIHSAGSRREKPFIALNCAALPRELIQSELFGYEKGSFTGADKGGKPGKFESAQGGTLFLDEIGDMPLEAQANLLRVLQEKKVVRIGGNRARSLDVRIISATNKDLLAEVKAGRFRQDLYYRLAVINIYIPPLCRRPEDIWPLAKHFLWKNRDLSPEAQPFHFARRTQALLRAYAWPGNVRELENLIIYLLSRGAGPTVEPRDLPDRFQASAPAPEAEKPDDLETIGCLAVEAALRKCDGNISKAAKLLNVSRTTVYKKMRRRQTGSADETGE